MSTHRTTTYTVEVAEKSSAEEQGFFHGYSARVQRWDDFGVTTAYGTDEDDRSAAILQGIARADRDARAGQRDRAGHLRTCDDCGAGSAPEATHCAGCLAPFARERV